MRRLGDLPRRSDVGGRRTGSPQWRRSPCSPRQAWRQARGGSGPAAGNVGQRPDLRQGSGPLLQTAKRVLTPAGEMVLRLYGGRRGPRGCTGISARSHHCGAECHGHHSSGGNRERVTDQQVAEFLFRHGLVPGRTGLYLGRFHSTKRIPFLLEAGWLSIVKRMPEFKLLVAGDGECRSLIEASAARGEAVICWGPSTTSGALLGAASQLMLMPRDGWTLRGRFVRTAHPSDDGRLGLSQPGVRRVPGPRP